MRIVIAGAGYVGLVAGACYASTGNTVTMVDTDEKRIDTLRAGGMPIYEPGLADLLAENRRAGRISFETDLTAASADAEMIGLAVGTPPREDGSADMSFVEAAAEQIARGIRDYVVVVTKSTVPVGTCNRIREILRANTEYPFDYVSNPEFLKEGSAVDDFLSPDRVIIGTESPRARRIMEHLYEPFMRQGRRILFMDPISAELTKYACNSMLATRISFMNEMARLAEKVGADIQSIRAGMGSDGRIGRAFLFPGLGYGGSCFPKDVKALVHTGEVHNVEMGVVRSADQANQTQVDWLFEKMRRYYDGDLKGKNIALWGLAFKPRTDDMREAPSLKLIGRLLAAGASVSAHDPAAHEAARKVLGDSITYDEDAYGPLAEADGLAICTEWMEFRTPDFKRMAKCMRRKVIFDGRNLYDPQYVNDAGIDYLCIGRPDAVLKR
ncbi:MAG: UDP-glucose/GDP-mannose dehydrogenase family protein [Phycisphaerae bacterium]|nr:UDP-glucose/GDP-mannose dehydrogenase family protein [Phycisphaerae bacterium]